MSAETKPNIYHRLQIAIDKAGVVEKTGVAPQAVGGFAYHKIDDVVDHMRLILIDAGIAVIPSVESCEIGMVQMRDKTAFHSKAFLTVRLVNVDKPEEFIEMRTVGDGIDPSDKSTGKAFSYALKNILLAAFQLRGQPDNEADSNDIPAQGKVTQPPAAAPAPPPASPPPKQNGHKPSMDERKAAPWAVPDLSQYEPKLADWRKVMHHKRKDKGSSTPNPKPLGDCSKQEIKWWADNWCLPWEPTKEDMHLRVALNVARKEMAIEEAGGGEPSKEWPAPGDDPFV